MLEKLKELLGQINMQAIKIYLAVIIGGSALLGFVVQLVITNVDSFLGGAPFHFDLSLFLRPSTWISGFLVVLVFMSVVWIGGGHMTSSSGRGLGLLSGKKGKNAVDDSPLENSRFLTDKERDKYFPFNATVSIPT